MLSNILGSGSSDKPEDAPAPRSSRSGVSGFITSSPRKADSKPASRKSTPRSVAAGSSGAESSDLMSPQNSARDSEKGEFKKSGLLDTLFSPMFNLFGGKDGQQAPDDVPMEDEQPPQPPSPPKTVEVQVTSPGGTQRSVMQVVQPEEEDEEEDEMDTDEFDPYSFIRSLPPLGPERSKIRSCLPKKTRNSPPISLVLDLDETLLHSSIAALEEYDIKFAVHFNATDYQVYVRKRPHVDYFMSKVAGMFEIIVFTASQKVYADKLLNILDPQRKWIKHRVFRDDCLLVDGNYLKDLNVLGRDLNKCVIVDNSPQAFGYQLDNGIPIESWFDDKGDTELLKLLPFLEQIVDVEDVRPFVREQFKMHELVHRKGK